MASPMKNSQKLGNSSARNVIIHQFSLKKKKKKRNYKLVYHQRIWPLAEGEEGETNYSALWSQWIDWEAVNLAFERTCADWKGKVSIRNNPIDKHGS